MIVTKKIPEFKVVFLGDTAVGKTSIIMRYQHDIFMEDFQSTVGAAFVSKNVQTSFGEASLHVWDTAGQERYRSLVPMYSRGATAVLIVYDISERTTFDTIGEWVEQVKRDIPPDCLIYIVGNKLDLNPSYDKSDAEAYAKSHGIKLAFVSALTGQGINELFADVSLSIPKSKFRSIAEDDVQVTPKQESGCC